MNAVPVARSIPQFFLHGFSHHLMSLWRLASFCVSNYVGPVLTLFNY